jgi:hypothetical protein
MVAREFQRSERMTELCRNKTLSVESGLFGSLRLMLGMVAMMFGMLVLVSPAVAQDQEEDQPFPLNCEDGTKLTALFTENDVTVTIADGTSIKLPFKTDDPFVLYTDGKHQLAEKGDVLEWTIGKKAPTICSPEDDDVETPFDQPVAVDNVDLPANKDNPDAKPSVNCYRFKGFMVKEVDLGEVGAEKLAVLPEDAKCVRDDSAEKKVSDPVAGYFLGAKGNLAFFQAPDGFNGGMPYIVFDTTSMKKLFEDSFEGADFEKIDEQGGKLTLDYIRTFSADCSLYLDGTACAQKIKKETGIGTTVQLPDCTEAYNAEKKRTPDYAKEIEQLPSVVSYPVTATFDGTAVTYTPRAGDTTCRVPD